MAVPSDKDVLNAIQLIRGVLNDGSSALRKMLNENEKITRLTVSAEVDIKNNIVAQRNLKEEIKKLNKEIAQGSVLKTRTAEALKKGKETSAKLDKENDDLAKAVNALESANSKMRAENKSLAATDAKLEAKNEKLKADVTRLKDLRTKYLAEIAEFRSASEE